MAPILIERRPDIVERDIVECTSTSADPLVGGVGDDAVKPGAESRVTPERVDLAEHAPESILDGLLRIRLVACDSHRQAIGSVAKGGDERLCRHRVVLAQGRQELVIPIESRPHVNLHGLGHRYTSTLASRHRGGYPDLRHSSQTLVANV